MTGAVFGSFLPSRLKSPLGRSPERPNFFESGSGLARDWQRD